MKPWHWIGLALVAVVAGTAQAQGYKWLDNNGHVHYGDVPPPGANATPLRPPPEPATSSAPGAAGTGGAKDTIKGPLTPAEQDLAFRRRLKEAQEAAAKADRERQDAEAKKANCESARQALETLGSGQRIMRADSNGERYFISDAQRAQDTSRAREAVSQWCK